MLVSYSNHNELNKGAFCDAKESCGVSLAAAGAPGQWQGGGSDGFHL